MATRPEDQLFAVYDKLGNKHMVSNLNAIDLVRHCGYSRQPPIVLSAEPAVTVTPPSTSGTVPPPAPPEKVPAGGTEKTAPVDLTAMTRDQLVAFAKEHFDMTFDAKVSEKDILDAILAEEPK